MISRATLRRATCLRCDYEWTPAYPLSVHRPKACPACSSRVWDNPRLVPRLDITEIVTGLAACTTVTLAQMRAPTRTRSVSAWRAAVIVILRADHWTFEAIGLTLQRSHSTILYHVRMADRQAQFHSTVSHEVAALAAALAARQREKGAA